jgi:LPS-assembly protein
LGKNDTIYKSRPSVDAMGIAEINASLPMIKNNNSSNETLTPKISFRVNPGNNMKNHSTSNKLLDPDNIFEINRLGLSDSFEAGKSLTFGIDYKFDMIENELVNNEISEDEKVLKDKFLEFKLATVLRDREENEIPISSTINKKNSGLFGSINNHLFEHLELGYDFIINNNYDNFESHNLSSKFSINNFVTEFDYVERTSNLGADHVLSNKTSYEVDENNILSFSTRRNKEINLTEYYDLSYEYKNDCLTAGIKYNKTFYQDNDLKPSENLFFTITLIPLTTYERIIYEN